MATPPSNTVIVGAGIIGLSTAYYLSQSTHTPATTIHIVEATPTLFASASGYAGGFLAADWFGVATAPLGALSFRLHRELANAHGGRERWGYSRSISTSVAMGSARGMSGHDWLRQGGSRAEIKGGQEVCTGHEGPAWLARREGQSVDVISEGESTAQVDPRRLCEFLLHACSEKGVVLHQPATVSSVSKDMKDELAGVRILENSGEELDLPCTRLIITAGAWSPQVFSSLFPRSSTKLPIDPYAGHSLVVRSPRWSAEHESTGCHAVFVTSTTSFSPEVFSRIGSEIFIGGLNSSCIPLPCLASDSKVNPKDIETLKTVTEHILGVPGGKNSDLEVLRESLCFRPVTKKGPPLVCRIPDNLLGGMKTRDGGDGGVFLAAGHGPWGISQSLGTGKVLSEVVEGQKTSVDISGLSV